MPFIDAHDEQGPLPEREWSVAAAGRVVTGDGIVTYERNVTKPKRPTLTPILVQVKDAEGFWCNLPFDPQMPQEAKDIARDWAEKEKAATRVTVGPKRTVIAEFQ